MMTGDEASTASVDTMAADPAPASTKAKPKRKGTGRPPGRPRKQSLEAPLREMLSTVGTVWTLAEAARGHAEPSCGEILSDQAASIAAALNAVAQDDPTVYKWLNGMMTGGGWGSVVLATWPVAQAILGYHVLPAISARREAVAAPADDGGPFYGDIGPDLEGGDGGATRPA